MTIAGVIGSFKTGTYVVTRTLASTVAVGRKVAGASSTLNLDMSIQPAMGAALKVIPSHRSAEDVRVIYCASELKMLAGAYEADVVAIGGEAFEIFKVEQWPRHWRAYAARQVRP